MRVEVQAMFLYLHIPPTSPEIFGFIYNILEEMP